MMACINRISVWSRTAGIAGRWRGVNNLESGWGVFFSVIDT